MEESDTLLMTPLNTEVTNLDLIGKGELFDVAKVPNTVHEIDDEEVSQVGNEDESSQVSNATETNPADGEEIPLATTILMCNGNPGTYESRSSLASTVNVDVCRICHCESEPDAPLISPCVCSGSLKYVHQACLQQWIKSADTKSCELCKYDFAMTTKIKPFRKWQKLDLPTTERRKLMCSVTFHFVAITCVIWALYVLIEKATQEIHKGMLEWPFWTKLIVVAIGFTGGLVFMYVQCKMYVQLCRRWRAYNRVIFIQNMNVGELNQQKAPTAHPAYTPTKSNVISMQAL